MKKRDCIFFSVAVFLIALFGVLMAKIPVKKAVYENKEDEVRICSVTSWYWSGKKPDNVGIIKPSIHDRQPVWMYMGTSYIGEYMEHHETPMYCKIEKNDPLSWLNSNFDPQKTENSFAIKYGRKEGDMPAELKDGYYEKSVVITDWVPIYPIRRSGWLASRLLPDDRLVIWDFIGWRACW